MEKLLTIIDGPRLTSCSFATRQIKNKSNKKVEIEIKLSAKVVVNSRKGTASISWLIQSLPVDLPFKFDVEVEGLFKMAKKLSEKELFDASNMEAGPLLVVALRDIVSDLTRKAELTPFYLSYPDFVTLRPKAKRNSSLSRAKTKSLV